MKLNNILEVFRSRRDFIEEQEKLCRELLNYLTANIRPDLTKFANEGGLYQAEEQARLDQMCRTYQAAFIDLLGKYEKAILLLTATKEKTGKSGILERFKEYKPDLAADVKEAERFVECVRNLLAGVEI